MRKLCVFDLDGTLLDTVKYIANRISFVFSLYHLPPVSESECIAHFEKGESEMFFFLLSSRGVRDLDLVAQIFRSLYKLSKEETSMRLAPYGGTMDLLFHLQEMGVHIAVLTTQNETFIKKHLYRVFPNVEYLATPLEGEERKPKPDSLLRTLSHFGVAKEDALYIGDSELDLLMGKNAGVETLSASWGYRSPQYLESVGAEHIVSLPQDVLSYIIE